MAEIQRYKGISGLCMLKWVKKLRLEANTSIYGGKGGEALETIRHIFTCQLQSIDVFFLKIGVS